MLTFPQNGRISSNLGEGKAWSLFLHQALWVTFNSHFSSVPQVPTSEEVMAATCLSHMGHKYPERLDQHQQCLWMEELPVWFLVSCVPNPVAEGQLLCLSDGELRFCLMESNGNFWQLCSESCWEQMVWSMITCVRLVKRWGELWLHLLLYRAMTKHQITVRNVAAGWK